MSKAEQKEQPTVKVFLPTTGPGAYGFDIIEINKSVLEKNGKVISKAEPDIFSICLNNLTKAFRDAFGI